MWQYDHETAVRQVASDRWSSLLSAGWNIGNNPNGGYLAAVALRALSLSVGRPDPVSVTIHYLRPGLGGEPAVISTEPMRAGRQTATGTASLVQDGSERLRMVAAFADLAARAGDAAAPQLTIPAPELPPPDACRLRSTLAQGVELPLASRLDIRIDPALAEPGAANRAEVAGWVRFADGRPPDTAALVLFADAFPPSVFGLLGPVGWVPTLELTVHVRRPPVSGWIAARFRTQDLTDGLLIEDGELWDEAGNLVARSRQLALLRTA